MAYLFSKITKSALSLITTAAWHYMSMQMLNAVGCGDNAIRLYESWSDSHDDHAAAAFQLALTKQQAHNADVNCVRWSPKDPRLLATAGDDNTVRIWQYRPDPDSSVMTG